MQIGNNLALYNLGQVQNKNNSSPKMSYATADVEPDSFVKSSTGIKTAQKAQNSDNISFGNGLSKLVLNVGGAENKDCAVLSLIKAKLAELAKTDNMDGRTLYAKLLGIIDELKTGCLIPTDCGMNINFLMDDKDIQIAQTILNSQLIRKCTLEGSNFLEYAKTDGSIGAEVYFVNWYQDQLGVVKAGKSLDETFGTCFRKLINQEKDSSFRLGVVPGLKEIVVVSDAGDFKTRVIKLQYDENDIVNKVTSSIYSF